MSNRHRQLCVEELEGRVVLSALVYSSNWSGYAAVTDLRSPQANSVSSVSGNWVVPAVTGSTNAYSVVWVGIDGYSSRSVEQIGTEQDTLQGGGTFYRAWYEMYPAPPVTIPITINPGDSISASVVYDQVQQAFVLSITDTTTPGSFSTIQTLAGAQRSSAEWIVEAPLASFGKVLPLANFGHADFSGASATINGVTGPIDNAAWQNTAIDMVSKHTVIATTSPLTDTGGTSGFTVTYLGGSPGGGHGGGGQHGNGPDLPMAAISVVPSLSTASAIALIAVPSGPAQHTSFTAVPATYAASSNMLSPAAEAAPVTAAIPRAAFAVSDTGTATPNNDGAAKWEWAPAATVAEAAPMRQEFGASPDGSYGDASVQAVASIFANALVTEAEAGNLGSAGGLTWDVVSNAGLALLVLGLNPGGLPEKLTPRSVRSSRRETPRRT